ncbi:MAG: hypothetical protein IT324_22955 [Anaerolineae bacterium]|nr:hypothetical protein [Anaerolineae bacterium]
MFEAPDENYHFAFVQRLTQSWELPVQDASVKTPWDQEGSQPPLYYLVASLVARLVPADVVPYPLAKNPHAQIGIGLAQINHNVFVHTPDEAFPWHGLALRFHLVRFFSIVMGAITVYVVHRTAQLAVRESPTVVRIVAAVFVTFNPMFLFITSSINNDNMVMLWGALASWLMLKIIQHGYTTRRVARLAIVIALASLSKLSGLTLYVPAGAMLLLLALNKHHYTDPAGELRHAQSITWRQLVAAGAMFGIAFVVIAGWWYARNWQLYGDPTGLRAMIAIVSPRQMPYTIGTMLDEMQGLRISFWALFGWFNVIGLDWFLIGMDILTALALIGGIVWVAYYMSKQDFRALFPIGILGLQFLVTFVSLINWTRQTPGTQGRLLFPAIAAIATLTALGWRMFGQLIWRKALAIVPISFMFIVAILTPFLTIAPAYAAPPTITRLPDDAVPVEVRFDTITVIGFRIDRQPVPPSGSLPVTVYYQGEPDARNLSLYLTALDRNNKVVGKIDSYPGGGNLPTSTWDTSKIYADTYRIPISATAEGPAQFKVEFGWWNFATNTRTQPLGVDNKPIEALILRGGSLLSSAPAPLPSVAQQATFSEALRFNGYTISPMDGVIKPGKRLDVSLMWEALSSVYEDFTVFVHLESADSKPIAQDDGMPLRGAYPTSAWAVGQPFADPRSITIPGNLSPGQYRIVIGLYRAGDGSRLPVDTGGDALTLHTPITVR